MNESMIISILSNEHNPLASVRCFQTVLEYVGVGAVNNLPAEEPGGHREDCAQIAEQIYRIIYAI